MSLKSDENAVAIDYETFYDTKAGYSLSSMSPQNYCADPRFDPYLVAICGRNLWAEDDLPMDTRVVKLPDGTEKRVPMCDNFYEGRYNVLPDGRQTYVGRVNDFYYWENLSGRILVAHNAGFDSVVFDECNRRGCYNSSLAKDVEWQCTADLTAYLGVQRNLKAAMKWLFGKEISKEVRAAMDGKHYSDLSEKQIMDVLEYGCSDAIECHDLWLKYASKWPEVERRISRQNRDAIARGVLVDRTYAESALKELECYERKVVCDIPWTSEINPKTKEFYKVGSLPALRQAVINLGVEPPKSFKKDDPGFLRWLEQHDDIPFIRARQKAVSIAMHSSRVKGIIDSLDANGHSHPSFLYFGAHTGRFSGKSSTGGGNVNMLNMPRKPVLEGDENVFGGKGVDIRGMYIPHPGHKFVVFDYSQIEARFSLWLVNDTHMMNALREEGNLYGANAVAMGWCKPHSDIKHTQPDLYRLAKCCLTEDALILVRTWKKPGRLTRPYYKRIISLSSHDWVWDGTHFVHQDGVIEVRKVRENELREIGGVWATYDHKVYAGEDEVHQLGYLFRHEKAAAVAWGQSTNPVQGWAHVRILAAALAGACAKLAYVAVRKALRVPYRPVPVHGVRTGGDSRLGEREGGTHDTVQVVRAEGVRQDAGHERVGEGAR